MNRLVPLTCAIVFLDAALFGALIPLLPGYVDDFELTKLEAGLLFAAFGAGALAGGIPAGVAAARLGPKRAVIGDLCLLALASVAFGISGGALALGLARFLQGVSSAITWAGALGWVAVETDRGRRGQVLGTVFGVAVFGFITGPMLGALAAELSVRAVFLVVAVLALVLVAVTAAQQPSAREPWERGAVGRVLRDPRFLAGLWLNTLPAFFFGILDVLATLRLDRGGYGVVAIGVVFVVAGLVEVGFNPIVGRVSDRRGRLVPVRIGLGAAIVVGAVLAFAHEPLLVAGLIVLAGLAYGGFYTPGMALVADRAEIARLPQGFGFGLTNTAWAIGASLGPSLGGGVAHITSDAVPYLICSVLCATTLVVVGRSAPRLGRS